MSLLSKPSMWLWPGLMVVALGAGVASAAGGMDTTSRGVGDSAATASLVDARLQQLAARSSRKDAWPLLRRYAAAAKGPEQRGLAYFVLGYQQYVAGQYAAAASTLREAASTKFSLADFAEYYSAAAAGEAGQWTQAIGILDGFSARNLKSTLRLQALQLLARAYIQADQAESAIQVLTTEPRVLRLPSLALLLAESYLKGEKFQEAARTFQEVYYAFPTAPESDAASNALRGLQAQLGASFPPVAEEVQTARAEIFLRKNQPEKALPEFESLLRERPGSPLADRWKLSRAKCFLSLRQMPQAIESLEALATTNPGVEAERLAALAEAYGRRSDAPSMLRELNRLADAYPQSPSYASALSWVSSFFARRGEWGNAIRFDYTLAEQFPQTESGREGNWRVAWAYYLERQDEKASQGLLEHLKRYPASPHVPAALYWLGRICEGREAFPEARALYQFLDQHFAHNYHAVLARRRLVWLPPGPLAGEVSDPSSPHLSLVALETIIPHLDLHPLGPCVPADSDALRPWVILKSLGLASLAEEYLKAELTERPEASELLLVFSRLKRQERDFDGALRSAKKLVPIVSQYHFAELSEEIWDLLYPQSFRRIIEQQARANGIKPYLVMGVIREESGFNPRATSWADARGLMQIRPQTISRSPRRRRLAARKLYDPGYNVRFGCRYLRDLLHRYKGNLEQALAAYNAGTPIVNAWAEGRQFREPGEFMETIPIPATRVYVEAVLRDAEVYRQLITGVTKFKKCS